MVRKILSMNWVDIKYYLVITFNYIFVFFDEKRPKCAEIVNFSGKNVEENVLC